MKKQFIRQYGINIMQKQLDHWNLLRKFKGLPPLDKTAEELYDTDIKWLDNHCPECGREYDKGKSND